MNSDILETYDLTHTDLSKYEYSYLKFGDQRWEWCHKYAHDVVTGKIIACKWIKLACARHLHDLTRDDLYFDEDEAQLVVDWFELIPITDGLEVGQATVLFPWQIFMVCCLAAWKYKATGLRKYKYAYVQVARKGGKSTLSGGLTLYFMCSSGYFRPRAYSVATKKDQAKILWSAAKLMIDLSEELQSIFKARANDILLPSKAGEFRPLASDSNSLDGLNPLVATLDECHAIKDRNLYGVMVSAFGSQPEGLMLTITTAGTILDGICTDLNKAGKEVLARKREYDAYFYLLYELDKGDQWDLEENWYKSNPALGHQPKLEYLRSRCTEAQMLSAEKINFLTKHCNMFVTGADKWLDIDEVKLCRNLGLNIEDYKGKRCVVSIDRSLVSDITSICLLFPDDDGGCTCFYINILPRQAVNNATDHLKEVYLKAEAEGNLEIVEGKIIHNSQLYKYFIWIAENFDVEMYGYDPYKMKETAMYLEDEHGLLMVSVSQGVGNMSEPAKKLETLIKGELFRYNDNLFEFACENAIQGVTKMNNVAIYRENVNTEKIDPLIATVIALSCATLHKVDENVYEQRGLLTI